MESINISLEKAWALISKEFHLITISPMPENVVILKCH